MLDQVAKQLAAPADAAFEEGEFQRREALRHAAEQQRTAERFAALAERADRVEHVVGRRAVGGAAEPGPQPEQRRAGHDPDGIELQTADPRDDLADARARRRRRRQPLRVPTTGRQTRVPAPQGGSLTTMSSVKPKKKVVSEASIRWSALSARAICQPRPFAVLSARS